jgi:hypothetical protein
VLAFAGALKNYMGNGLREYPANLVVLAARDDLSFGAWFFGAPRVGAAC